MDTPKLVSETALPVMIFTRSLPSKSMARLAGLALPKWPLVACVLPSAIVLQPTVGAAPSKLYDACTLLFNVSPITLLVRTSPTPGSHERSPMSAMHLVSTLLEHTSTKLWPAGQDRHTLQSLLLSWENLPNVQLLQSVASAPPLYVPAGQDAQTNARSESEYCPSLHDVQIVAIEAEYLPAGQFLHDGLLVAVYCPFSQIKHSKATEAENLPPGHNAQIDTPCTEYLPPGHSVQLLDSVILELNSPDVQFEHCGEDEFGACFPPGLSAQIDTPCTEYLPTGHSVQPLDSFIFELNSPEMQFEHCGEDELAANLPPGHNEQIATPCTEYLPAGHSVQLLDTSTCASWARVTATSSADNSLSKILTSSMAPRQYPPSCDHPIQALLSHWYCDLVTLARLPTLTPSTKTCSPTGPTVYATWCHALSLRPPVRVLTPPCP